jgi:hypothetical protein
MRQTCPWFRFNVARTVSKLTCVSVSLTAAS